MNNIEIARSWLGTKWHHNQCVKGVGVDCVNFLGAVAREWGYDLPKFPSNYSRVAIDDGIKIYLDDNLIPTNIIDSEIVLMFQFSGYNNHVAIATSETTMIHASFVHKKVVEHNIDGVWLRMLKGMWRLK